jgi:uncharacterized membrane protein
LRGRFFLPECSPPEGFRPYPEELPHHNGAPKGNESKNELFSHSLCDIMNTVMNTNDRKNRIGFRTRLNQNSSFLERVADYSTRFFGKTSFLIGNILVFAIWILWNVGYLPWLSPFDPYPFGFLTMTVSLEAIILSIAVLITQNREGEIADLREETDFEINVRAENEVTKILNMLDDIHEHLGISNKDDAELRSMKERTDIDALEEEILKERK